MSDLLKIYGNIETAVGENLVTSALGIPPKGKRQIDLQYITSVFVSSGFNLNSAFFLPSELIKAKDTIIEKALDLEHEIDRVVGHLYSYAFANKDGSLLDIDSLLETAAEEELDSMSFDIITGMRLYKARFEEIAEAVEAGEYKVSMECYFRDFDIIVDDIIIPKEEAKSLGLIEVVNNVVTVISEKSIRSKCRVGRVLRDMLFSGCGLVKNPANPDSVILETASYNDKYILDLTKVDSYMKTKMEKEALVINKLEGGSKDAAYIYASYGGVHRHDVLLDKKYTFVDGPHIHLVMPSDVPEGLYVYFTEDGSHKHSFNKKDGIFGGEKGHTHKVYVEGKLGDKSVYTTVEASPSEEEHYHELQGVVIEGDYLKKDSKKENRAESSFSGGHYHRVVLEDGTELKTVTPSDILELESAGVGNMDGHPLSKPDMCVSFKRKVFSKGGDNPGVPANADKTPGMVPQVESLPASTGGGPAGGATQGDTLIHENWCALFETDCPVLGGQATHPDCLRLVLDSTTNEVVSNYFEKLQKNRKSKVVSTALSSLVASLKDVERLLG